MVLSRGREEGGQSCLRWNAIDISYARIYCGTHVQPLLYQNVPLYTCS